MISWYDELEIISAQLKHSVEKVNETNDDAIYILKHVFGSLDSIRTSLDILQKGSSDEIKKYADELRESTQSFARSFIIDYALKLSSDQKKNDECNRVDR